MALGVSAAQEVLSSLTTTAALGALTGAANLILVYFYNVRLAVIATVLVLIGAGVCVIVGIFEVRWQRKSYKNEQRLSARVFQLLGAVPKLRVTAAEERTLVGSAIDRLAVGMEVVRDLMAEKPPLPWAEQVVLRLVRQAA